MSSTLIKNVPSKIAIPLTLIFNKSIPDGQFPTSLKIAKICPVYKCDNKLLVNNYRPIPILPTFLKIFERLKYNRLLEYINKNNILFQNQYDFREKHSTFMTLLKLIDDISNEVNNKIYSVGIFIYLSKAFDHSLLIKKLRNYGVKGIVADWFVSYLSNRSQYRYVKIDDTSSALLNVSCGVPQGSILGLLLFIIYVNAINNSSNIAILFFLLTPLIWFSSIMT